MSDPTSGDADPAPIRSRGHCPACGYTMTLVRITPRAGPLPELRMFLCEDCDHVLTVEMED
jgi:hypothetical protein